MLRRFEFQCFCYSRYENEIVNCFIRAHIAWKTMRYIIKAIVWLASVEFQAIVFLFLESALKYFFQSIMTKNLRHV